MYRAETVPLRLERRAKPRVVVPFRVTVQGVDKTGVPFEAATVLDNLGPGGLYVRLMKDVKEGARLLIDVCMDCQAAESEVTGLRLEVYGLVKRVDRVPGGAFGVAVSFTSSVLL